MYKIGKPCATSKSYFITPEREIEINLEELSERLKEKGWEARRVSRVIAIFEKNGIRISVFPTGKIIVKEVSKETAEKVAQEIWEVLSKMISERSRSLDLDLKELLRLALLCP